MITPSEAETILEANFAEWVRDLRLTVESTGADQLRLRIAFSQKLCRVGGIVCGQALISAADTAMVLALASALGGLKPLTTVDLTINYMRPIKDEDTWITASIKRLGKTLAFCTAEIEGAESAKLAAFATGTYAILA